MGESCRCAALLVLQDSHCQECWMQSYDVVKQIEKINNNPYIHNWSTMINLFLLDCLFCKLCLQARMVLDLWRYILLAAF